MFGFNKKATPQTDTKPQAEVKEKNDWRIHPGDIVFEHPSATSFPLYVLSADKKNTYYIVLRFFDSGRGNMQLSEKTIARNAYGDVVKNADILSDEQKRQIEKLVQYYHKTGKCKDVYYSDVFDKNGNDRVEVRKAKAEGKYQTIVTYFKDGHHQNVGSDAVDLATAQKWEKDINKLVGKEKSVQVEQIENSLSTHLSLEHVHEVGLNRADENCATFYWRFPKEKTAKVTTKIKGKKKAKKKA